MNRYYWAGLSLLLLALPVDASRHSRSSSNTPSVDRPPTSSSEPVNDFPTQARVEYVISCMTEHGGHNLDNMYHCVCAIDSIAHRMNFQEYSEALTFTNLFDLPGERGGEFRDPPQSKLLRDKLKEVKHEAERCFPEVPQAMPSKQ